MGPPVAQEGQSMTTSDNSEELPTYSLSFLPPPFTPQQEARIREIVEEMLSATLSENDVCAKAEMMGQQIAAKLRSRG